MADDEPNTTNPPVDVQLSEEALERLAALVASTLAAAQPQPTASVNAQNQAHLVLNDGRRTLATVPKPTKPKPYTGAIDADACLNFIDN